MSVKPELVSVCVTTFAHANYIEECIRSVLAQTADVALEVLVGDDGSTDGTRDLVSRYAALDTRVCPMFHPERLGPSGNLSALVRASRGRYIAHLDGDDAWSPRKLEEQLQRLRAFPEASAVYTNAEVIAPDGRPLGIFNRGLPDVIDRRELLRRGNMLCHSSLLYRREVADAVSGLRPPYIDYRIHLRLQARGLLLYIDSPLTTYRWRTPGSMIRTMPHAVIDGHLDAFREALALGADPADVRRAAARLVGRSAVQAALGRGRAGLRQVAAGLRNIGGLGASSTWLAGQAALAPVSAWRSVRSRSRGVYFP